MEESDREPPGAQVQNSMDIGVICGKSMHVDNALINGLFKYKKKRAKEVQAGVQLKNNNISLITLMTSVTATTIWFFLTPLPSTFCSKK